MLPSAQQIVTSTLVFACIAFTVLANIVLKGAAENDGMGAVWPFTVINIRVLMAATAFAMAFLFYTMLLKRMPLSMAQAILSVQFVFVILAANVLLNEEIGFIRWIGIGLMAIGLCIVGLSPEANQH